MQSKNKDEEGLHGKPAEVMQFRAGADTLYLVMLLFAPSEISVAQTTSVIFRDVTPGH